jgi:hypothetical protein
LFVEVGETLFFTANESRTELQFTLNQDKITGWDNRFLSQVLQLATG